LHVPRLGDPAVADQPDSMRRDFGELVVVLANALKQLHLIARHELQSIHVIAKLVDLAEDSVQRLLVRREESRGHPVEVARCIELHLSIGFDLALKCDQVLGVLIYAT
jgi:hypothetical protein